MCLCLQRNRAADRQLGTEDGIFCGKTTDRQRPQAAGKRQKRRQKTSGNRNADRSSDSRTGNRGTENRYTKFLSKRNGYTKNKSAKRRNTNNLSERENYTRNMVHDEDIPRILVQEEHCQKETATESPTIAPQAEPQTAQTAVVPQEPVQTQNIAQEDIWLCGENKYPVTQMELKKIQNFARKLFQKHNFGRILNEFDIDKIMKYTVARREINGVAVGVLDREKADLLEYAVEQAEAAEKLNWRYIEGIYRNFLLRDIKTSAEAYQYDLSRDIPVL